MMSRWGGMCRLVWAGCVLLCSAAAGFCPMGCSCDDDTLVVSCLKASLDVIPITLNPSIQRLVLKDNKVKTVDAAFHFYGELQFVDLSSNHLVSIPTRSFESQKKLVELHLDDNRISAITNKTFDGMKKLTVLSLRGNFLEDLPDRLFSALPQLEELNLGKNRINRIDSTAFVGLTSLRVLYLDDNQLRHVPTSCFPPLGSLAELHVGLNVFDHLPDDSFKGLSRLTILNLKGAVVNISENAFRGLAALRVLTLTGNSLRAVPTKQLGLLTRLEELSIGQNDFTTLELNSFKGLVNLRRLEISGAPVLERVKRGAFSSNLNLETLVLNSNKKLVVLEDSSLTGLPNLRQLSLRDNAFAGFQENLVNWPELRKLDVSENPFDCSCSLLWLGELLAGRNSSPVLCETPRELKDKSLKGLSAHDLGCSTAGPYEQMIVAGLCGTGIALIALLAVLAVRYRKSVHDALVDYKWKKRAKSRKDMEYRKTFSEDDVPNYMAPQPPLRPIPVTEL